MYIGRQQLGGPIAKLDDISSEFDGTKTSFNLSLGATAYFANNPFALMVSIGGVIQEPVNSYTIIDDTITFAGPPAVGTNFFAIVLATNSMTPLKSLSISTRNSLEKLDIHGTTFSVLSRTGKIPVAFNAA